MPYSRITPPPVWREALEIAWMVLDHGFASRPSGRSESFYLEKLMNYKNKGLQEPQKLSSLKLKKNKNKNNEM